MLELNRTKCCGLRELHGINIPGIFGPHRDWGYPKADHIIEYVHTLMFNGARKGVLVSFVDVVGGRNYGIGDELADFIEEHRLGTVHRGTPVHNPNSGNKIVGYLWQVNLRTFNSKWLARYKAKSAKK